MLYLLNRLINLHVLYTVGKGINYTVLVTVNLFYFMRKGILSPWQAHPTAIDVPLVSHWGNHISHHYTYDQLTV